MKPDRVSLRHGWTPSPVAPLSCPGCRMVIARASWRCGISPRTTEELPAGCVRKTSPRTRSRHKTPLNEVQSTGGGAIEPPSFMLPW